MLIDIIKEVTSSTVLSIFDGEWGMGNGAVCGFVRLMYRNRHTLRADVRVGGPIAAPQHPSLAPFFSLLRRCPNLVIPALTERTAIASIRRIPAPHPFGANASVVQICSRQICPGSSVLSPTSLSANPSLHSSLWLKNNVPERSKSKQKAWTVFRLSLGRESRRYKDVSAEFGAPWMGA